MSGLVSSRDLNARILQFWKSEPEHEGVERVPLLYNDFRPQSLLFVGCNPSHTERSASDEIKAVYQSMGGHHCFYSWQLSKNDAELEARIRRVEQLVRHPECQDKKPYQYFGPLIKIAADSGFGDSWEHVDMFLVRETNQRKLRHLIEDRHSAASHFAGLNSFGRKQVEVFKDLLDLVRPSVIVVNNAFVSDVFSAFSGISVSDDDFDKDFGWHWFRRSGGVRLPIFFASMISGQRALDKGSRKRLAWHVGRAREWSLHSRGKSGASD